MFDGNIYVEYEDNCMKAKSQQTTTYFKSQLTNEGSLYQNEDEHNLDDSFEMKIQLEVQTDNPWVQRERDIVYYLRSRGLLMKTDPKLKQDQYYQKSKRKPFLRANTMVYQKSSRLKNPSSPDSSKNSEDNNCGMSLQMNSILQRRTPNITPQSSPLIVQQQSQIPEKRKSIFNRMNKRQQSFSSNSDQDAGNNEYFQNL